MSQGQGIWELIKFVQIGGGITIVGGLIGLYYGGQLAESCSNACRSGPGWVTGFSNCVNNCPDAFMYAFYGAIPGIIIGVVEWIIKKSRNPV